MALATQCPHCHTAFRVAHDQLKLRAGLVRCGSCKRIFNGIEHLLPPEDNDIQPTVKNEQHVTPHTEIQETKETLVSPEADTPSQPAQADIDPLQRMTLIDHAYLERRSADDEVETPLPEPDPDIPDPLEQAIDTLQQKPLAEHTDDPDEAEDEVPSFVKQGQRRQRVGRTLRVAMGIGSVVLLITLLAQSADAFRNQLAARLPQARPLLTSACSLLGCQIGLPAQIEAVSIESSELQALTSDKNTFALTVLLRNRGAIPQAWPNIELTLNDMNEKALARRIFAPRDYLTPAQSISQGLDAGSEQTIKIFLELSQLKASGFRVYLFYP